LSSNIDCCYKYLGDLSDFTFSAQVRSVYSLSALAGIGPSARTSQCCTRIDATARIKLEPRLKTLADLETGVHRQIFLSSMSDLQNSIMTSS